MEYVGAYSQRDLFQICVSLSQLLLTFISLRIRSSLIPSLSYSSYFDDFSNVSLGS
jgi:hypothetical protein